MQLNHDHWVAIRIRARSEFDIGLNLFRIAQVGDVSWRVMDSSNGNLPTARNCLSR
ncbi:hypothetical protein RBSWK_05429 [Rhodopirellula baltica SWK14]|uniref:Uncharacterized protein n=1 Tax=Rhodopirellula baltica SWK14 TaxID=993516 RepID=L7CA52_RHOBT|nr:hypothetical protein RBSWK_05429 [Rhodopirellula baltica SWK14]